MWDQLQKCKCTLDWEEHKYEMIKRLHTLHRQLRSRANVWTNPGNGNLPAGCQTFGTQILALH
jgi:hypothetical protein